ncbi:helix-hairpin-helix domain-containing protein [Streptomyces sp. BBFR102]|uniref:helix-hairpin-helix domain-containing protein n=1 Tax=Streptomyces sp. BBFR102 TaxID=3448171 RepID=UPI003F52EFE6
MVLRTSLFGVGVRDGQGRDGERAREGADDAVRVRAQALLGAGGPAGERPEREEPPDRAPEEVGWDDDRRIVGHPWWRPDPEEVGRDARHEVTGGAGAAEREPGQETGPRPRTEEGPSDPDGTSSGPGGTAALRERLPAESAERPRPVSGRPPFGKRGWGGLPVLLRARCGMEWRSVAALVVVVVVAVVWAAQHFWTGRPEPVRVPEAVSRKASETPGAAEGPPAPESTPAPAPPSPGAGPLVVDVSGKVARPGVHRLPAGSRVEDALEAAGGVRPGTDTSGLNRARLLTDGEQVAVGVDPAPGPGPVAGAVPGAPGTAAGPISLGTATAEQLETLPGVGPVLAAAIIAYRTENGGFRSVDQLRDVRGIGDRRFEDLRELVRP